MCLLVQNQLIESSVTKYTINMIQIHLYTYSFFLKKEIYLQIIGMGRDWRSKQYIRRRNFIGGINPCVLVSIRRSVRTQLERFLE